MPAVLTFEKALQAVSQARHRHLLLGNGFSIALKPDIFTYGSLYENADFSKAPHVTKLFDALKTQDFEVVIKHLQDAATVVEVYRPRATTLAQSLRRDAAAIKDALVTAIAKRHPDRPYDIKREQYIACRTFLAKFDHIFTLNYDVLLYWAMMQSEVDKLSLNHDDGFRHPEDEPDQPWVSWQQGNQATVCYLHGALHLFDAGTEITKYTWSKTDKPIVDQIRAALNEEKYPLFVAEGTSASKRTRILHSGYASYVARTAFVHTFAFNNDLKGVSPDHLRFSIFSPDADLSFIDDARQRFRQDSAYLDDRPNAPLRFNAEANLTQVIAREEKNIDAEAARTELRDRIRKIFEGSIFDFVPFASAPFDVPDDVGDGKPRLVLFSHDAIEVGADLKAVPELAAKIYERKGSDAQGIRLQVSATIDLPARFGTALVDDFRKIAAEFVRRREEKLRPFFPGEPNPRAIPTNYIWARTVSCPYCAGLVPLSPNWRLAADGTGIRLLPNLAAGVGSEGRICAFEIVTTEADQSPGNRLGRSRNLLLFGLQTSYRRRRRYAQCTRTGLDAIAKHLGSAPPKEVDDLRGKLCIGIHRDVEVTEAAGDARPLVSQAFCSALPVAYNRSVPTPHWEAFASLVLQAAYEATMAAAVLNAQRGASNVVLLTELGGGAFGNDSGWIHAAMRRALKMMSGFDLDVKLVSYRSPSQAILKMAEDFS